jgi:DNA-binding CsgD family transcriptional regulator
MEAGLLQTVADRFTGETPLTPAERAELLRIAQGFACKDSAAAARISPETIRARRKRIYRKLDVSGVGELLASMLAASLHLLQEQPGDGEQRSAASATEGIEPAPTIH